MSNIQKIIKNVAFAFAIFLIVLIFSLLVYGLKSIYYIFDDETYVEGKIKNELVNINSIDIELFKTNLVIENSLTFGYETNNKNIEFVVINDKLFINEKSGKWFTSDSNSTLTLYIPIDKVFDLFEFELGAGRANIESLSVKNASFELGAGKVNINDLNVLNKIEIDGGAGELNIHSSDINSLKLNLGIGKLYLKSYIIGNSELDLGIGTADIVLVGDEEDYKILFDKGIGSFYIDGVKIKDNMYYGRGNTTLKIDGGIGNIKVCFE